MVHVETENSDDISEILRKVKAEIAYRKDKISELKRDILEEKEILEKLLMEERLMPRLLKE